MKSKLLFLLFLLSVSVPGADKQRIQKSSENIAIRIKKGMSLDESARVLKKTGLIKSVFLFKSLMWAKGASANIKSGEYIFPKGAKVWQIMRTLEKGKTALYRVTFPEGFNIYEMADRLEKEHSLKQKHFLSLCHFAPLIHELLGEKRESLEGYLFPSTYYVPHPVSAKQLIRKMVQTFFTEFKVLTEKQPSATFKLTRHQLVILASIVEKETGKSAERGLISGVFYNRLNLGMRLQSDPTILYGMMREKGGLVPLNIRKVDIAKKNRYNTYQISGLPLGPVGNPGRKSLQAVLHPKRSEFLYFVSRNDGSHVFSKTYKEHKKAVNRYQKKY